MNRASPDNSRDPFAFLVLAVVLVLAGITGFIAYTLQQSQQRYFAESSSTSSNLAMALENGLWAHFHEVDLSLRRARLEFSTMHDEGRFNPEQFSSYLRGLKERMPQARSARGTDAKGMVVYGDDVDPSNPQDLKIREFYQRATTERELVFGVPVRSRITGELVFPLIYAMTYSDGSFGGTAYVNMNNARINELISSLNLGQHGVIALVDTQRRLLHRYPDLQDLDHGKALTVSPDLAAVLSSGAKNGTYRWTSALDGEKRSYNVERIGAYPVYILVGLAERDFLAPWKVEVRNAVAFLVVLFLLSAGLLAGVRIAMQRQRRAVAALIAKEDVLRTSVTALTESEARFRSLTQSLPQFVWTTTDARHFEYVSDHWHDFLGEQGKALARERGFPELVHPDDRACVRAAWRTALRGETSFRCNARLRRHDGVWRVFDNHALPQRDASGAVIGWVGSSTDITEERAAHDALMLAKDQALAAGRAKSEFVANMSHEIRSPMNAVLGMLQLLQRTSLAPVQRDYASKAETSARALLGILNDILDFSKVEEGKLALDPYPFNPDTLLRELAVILSANVAERDVEVIFNISPDLPRSLVGDALRLQQVLLNLTGNAIKFTPHGEVVLTVSPLATGAESTRILFSVRDTGIGIAPEQITSIFQGFSQAEASTARRFGGTGLGLAISQRLVMLMGGQLSVFSEPGQGSRFEFTITLGHGEPLPEPPINQSVQHLQCLVVDDNATCRDVLSAMAGAYGWHADAVASGAEALDAVQQHRYDVVFVDWRMPGMDGWETSKRLRALCNGPGRPLIIMVTAHDAALVADTEGQLGPVLDAMLVKPITASMLFDTVSDLRKGLTAPGPARDLAAMAALAAADAGSLDGVQLLVVDDNAMNLQVARELLGAVGATVTTADAGRAAIDIVCKGEQKFDLILMDIQMPDIDGYAATAAIHASLGAKAPAIIAMTANALATDRESALAAGMVDHVGKPFDLAQLIATILKHYAGMASEAAPTLTLDRTSALTRLGGNEGIYLGVLRGFPAEMAKIRIQVEEIAAGRRTESAAGAMHLLRGLAGMVGAARLAGLARIIEDALLGGASAESLAPQLRILIDEIGLASAAAMEASRE